MASEIQIFKSRPIDSFNQSHERLRMLMSNFIVTTELSGIQEVLSEQDDCQW